MSARLDRMPVRRRGDAEDEAVQVVQRLQAERVFVTGSEAGQLGRVAAALRWDEPDYPPARPPQIVPCPQDGGLQLVRGNVVEPAGQRDLVRVVGAVRQVLEIVVGSARQ